MLNIYLLRHGETTYNADGNRYCGRTDIGLTDKGLQQAAAVAKQLNGIHFEGLYASPLERAYQTACIASGDAQVQKEARLIEVDFGQWEGKTRAQFVAEDPESWNNWSADPARHRAGGNGETATEVVERVTEFFEEIRQKHLSGNILVVAHNGVNRLFMAAKLGMPLQNYRKLVQQNSAITLLSIDEEGEFSLELLNSKI